MGRIVGPTRFRAASLTFVSAIIQRGFRREFFDKYINQGVNGSFCGKEPGELRLIDLIDDVDFNDPAQTTTFVETIEKHLEIDHRSSKKFAMMPSDQLRKHTNVAALYDFLWSFTYLIPEYSLKLDGEDLNLLSPGERGALLLVFYLPVDRSDMPIIVDQPEENLDNQTVYFLLRLSLFFGPPCADRCRRSQPPSGLRHSVGT